ncbi:MAG TPA: hypothetical protein VFO46_03180 [Candidatus Sulfotelmatobacter sp.]|nr:hypothetical protein [Candidatus Sulfotelmatobacter sp.]
MTNKSFKQAPPVTRNLQRSFEHAVRDIYQAGLTGKASQYRTPIVQRASLPASGPVEEKRALSDAAKALAQLWKVSHNPSR